MFKNITGIQPFTCCVYPYYLSEESLHRFHDYIYSQQNLSSFERLAKGTAIGFGAAAIVTWRVSTMVIADVAVIYGPNLIKHLKWTNRAAKFVVDRQISFLQTYNTLSTSEKKTIDLSNRILRLRDKIYEF